MEIVAARNHDYILDFWMDGGGFVYFAQELQTRHKRNQGPFLQFHFKVDRPFVRDEQSGPKEGAY